MLTREQVLEAWLSELKEEVKVNETIRMYETCVDELTKVEAGHNKRVVAWTLVYQNLFNETFPLQPGKEAIRIREELQEEATEGMNLDGETNPDAIP